MTDHPSGMRLNKYIARHSGISRREADELIAQGRVQINGHAAVTGQPVQNADQVSVDDHVVAARTSSTILLMNKPVGYVCSRKRQGETPTIYELISEQYQTLKTVGRLDKDSSGLILLTDDGDLAHQMTHPRFHKVKIYEVHLSTDLQPLHRQMIADFGVMLEDGKSQLILDRIGEGNRDWQVTMSEGRNRQIRRTFSSLGYTVTKLHRTTFGPYALGDIKPGEYKKIDIS